MSEQIRKFATGATRDTALDPATGLPKLAYGGFFSAMVMKRRAEYMNKHRVQADGALRDPDNWKKGIPESVYLDSLLRHVMDLWLHFEGAQGVNLQETLCAISFNSDGLLHEVLKGVEPEADGVSCEACSAKGACIVACKEMNGRFCAMDDELRRRGF